MGHRTIPAWNRTVAHKGHGKTKSPGTTNFTHGKTKLTHGKTKLTHGKTKLTHGKTKKTSWSAVGQRFLFASERVCRVTVTHWIKEILSAKNTTELVVEIRPEKIFSGPHGEKSSTSSVVFLAARISYVYFFTAVKIYEFHISKILNDTLLARKTAIFRAHDVLLRLWFCSRWRCKLM